MWYLVISRPIVEREQVVANLPEHRVWQQQHHEDGVVLFSGPTADQTAGIYVMRAKSLQDTKEIADTDPLHSRAIRQYEMFEWACGEILGAGFGGSSRPVSQSSSPT